MYNSPPLVAIIPVIPRVSLIISLESSSLDDPPNPADSPKKTLANFSLAKDFGQLSHYVFLYLLAILCADSRSAQAMSSLLPFQLLETHLLKINRDQDINCHENDKYRQPPPIH